MNALTAAVIDFQKPLNRAAEKLATDPKTFNIHVAPCISEEQEFKLRLHFYGNLRMFQHYREDAEKARDDVIQKYRCLEHANRYKTGAMALIDGLQIIQAIDPKEYNRLSSLFAEQADLFDDLQAV